MDTFTKEKIVLLLRVSLFDSNILLDYSLREEEFMERVSSSTNSVNCPPLIPRLRSEEAPRAEKAAETTLSECQKKLIKIIEAISPGLNSSVVTPLDILYIHFSELAQQISHNVLSMASKRRTASEPHPAIQQVKKIKSLFRVAFLQLRGKLPSDGEPLGEDDVTIVAGVIAKAITEVAHLQPLLVKGELRQQLMHFWEAVREHWTWLSTASGLNSSFEAHAPTLSRLLAVMKQEAHDRGWQDLMINQTMRQRFVTLAEPLQLGASLRLEQLEGLLKHKRATMEALCTWATSKRKKEVKEADKQGAALWELAEVNGLVVNLINYSLVFNYDYIEILLCRLLESAFPSEELSEIAQNFNSAVLELESARGALHQKVVEPFQEEFKRIATPLLTPLRAMADAGMEFADQYQEREDPGRVLRAKMHFLQSWVELVEAAQARVASFDAMRAIFYAPNWLQEGNDVQEELQGVNELLYQLDTIIISNAAWYKSKLVGKAKFNHSKRVRKNKRRELQRLLDKPAEVALTVKSKEEVLEEPKEETKRDTPADSPVAVRKTRFLSGVSEKGWRGKGHPEQYRLHSLQLGHLACELSELKEIEGHLLKFPAGCRWLLSFKIARCHALLESSLLRLLSDRDFRDAQDTHVLDSALAGAPLRTRHSLLALAGALREDSELQSVLDTYHELFEELDGAHSLVFYLEGNTHGPAPRGTRLLRAILKGTSEAQSVDASRSSQVTVEHYVQRTRSCVHRLLFDQKMPDAVDLPLRADSSKATPPVSRWEESSQIQLTLDPRGAHRRIRRCQQLLRALKLTPVMGVLEGTSRLTLRNDAMQHIQRFVGWMDMILGFTEELASHPLSLTLPLLDALHRALKECVVALATHHPCFEGGVHLSRQPVRPDITRPLLLDNDVCASYTSLVRGLRRLGRNDVLRKIPKQLDERFGWLSGIHDRLYYPDRCRESADGVYLLCSRLVQGGRRLRRLAIEQLPEEGYKLQESSGRVLDPEVIRTQLRENTSQLLESAIYPGLDLLYLMLGSAFSTEPNG